MKVYIKGKGEVDLSQNDFLAQGGQGSVWGKGGIAYKVYTDPAAMIPSAKIHELSVLTDPKIIRPQDILLDRKNNPIGYTMRHLNNTVALCQLFTKGFRDRNAITPEIVLDLVKDMQKTYQHIHSANILVVDGNEMNFLVGSGFNEVYFIDVDSYQTQNYPAVALMESIRDRHCNGKFDKNTDWFAWGIVTFQLLIGIHPYKGKHKTINGLDDRMVNNVSVLRKEVGIPPVCQPFTVIPSTLRDWYKAVFDDGKRLPPPFDYAGVIILTADIRHITGTDKFEVKLLETSDADIVEFLSTGGVKVTVTTKMTKSAGGPISIGVGPRMGTVVFGTVQNNFASLSLNSGQKLPFNFAAEQMTAYDGRIYFKNGTTVYQVDINELKTSTIPAPRAVSNVHEKATKLFDGIAIQNLFGTAFITVFPEKDMSYTLQVKEIKGKIVDAKYSDRIVMVVAVDSAGKYNRYVLRLSKDFSSYEVFQTVQDIVHTGLNFTVLPKGICCHINEKNEVELFTNQPGNTVMKVVSDPMISSDMRLSRDGNDVLFAKGKELYLLKMK